MLGFQVGWITASSLSVFVKPHEQCSPNNNAVVYTLVLLHVAHFWGCFANTDMSLQMIDELYIVDNLEMLNATFREMFTRISISAANVDAITVSSYFNKITLSDSCRSIYYGTQLLFDAAYNLWFSIWWHKHCKWKHHSMHKIALENRVFVVNGWMNE